MLEIPQFETKFCLFQVSSFLPAVFSGFGEKPGGRCDEFSTQILVKVFQIQGFLGFFSSPIFVSHTPSGENGDRN